MPVPLRTTRLSTLLPRSRWFSLLVGIACVVGGTLLVLRPFTSLSVLVILVSLTMIVTGIGDLLDETAASRRVVDRVVGAAWIIAGLVALVWPDITVRTIAVVVGIAMIVTGVTGAAGVLRGRRATGDERAAAVIHGVAGIVFGLLALSWPDVTLLVVAVVFGARTVLFGLSRLAAAWRGVHDDGERGADDRKPQPPPRPWRRVARASVALVVALGLAVISVQIHRGQPRLDAFYDAPDDIPAEPGVLLRSEPFHRGVPDNGRAWRILYTTSRDDHTPALASAIVVAPAGPSSAPRPLIAWAHGTTGIARTCAPSVLEDPFGSGAFFALDSVIDEGWVLVATDYIGLGTEGPHPYLIGQGEGRSVLDSIRAARQLDEVLVEDQAVVWGHSQGGHAALWTGQLASSYAPDANVIGVAALAPASDLLELVGSLSEMRGGSVFASYVMGAYSATYPDVSMRDYVRPTAEVTVRAIANRCLAEPAVYVSIISSLLADWSIFARDPSAGAAGERLAQNSPTGPIEAPLLIAQGLTDSLVIPTMQDGFVERLCGRGQPVDYRTYAGEDHLSVVAADSPLIRELMAWTNDRLNGRAPNSTCRAG